MDLHDGVDIRDYEAVHTAIERIRPDYIFHLAALTYVPESFTNPQRAFEVNTIGSLNILEAVRQLGLKPKIHLAGTSEEYGDGGPNEDDLPNPLSAYAISKLAMDHLGRLYARSYKMQIVVTRAFNHAGPGRGEMFAESAFAKQMVEIERGERRILEHGNLEPVRNYTDVRDIVRAYRLAIELPSDVYNVCSDQNVTMQEMMDILKGYAKTSIPTKVNPNLYRPVDFSFKEPSCEKLTSLTGWKPEIKLEQTLEDILEDWRRRLV
jgi:GDP-4-dehydro-6-deoxy-D-mannose reductase